MMRLGAIFIAICMLMVAASVGAVLYLSFAFSGTDAGIVALGVLTCLILFNAVTTRHRDRSDVGTQIIDLSRGLADLARQVGDLARRMNAMEGKATAAVDRTLSATKPLTEEIGELGALVKALAESVASHDVLLQRQNVVPFAATAQLPLHASPPASSDDAPAAASRTDIAEGRFSGMARDDVVTLIRDAMEAGRIDLFLQPIVTLPQRKVRYYEAMTRLRTADGDVMPAVDFLPYAEAAGLMPRLDNLMLFKCVQVVRRLLAKNRDIGVFCNLSVATLTDAEFFPQVSEFMDANRAIAPALIFEFKQAAYRDMGPMETESLAALADRNYRFSLDHVTDLRVEPRDLAERGFRFLKVPAGLLLDRATASASDIHPADVAGLMSRHGVDLVATKIETEGVVVDLLDYDVKFGQGFLFSPPRPVRAEILQGFAERNDVVMRDAPPAEDKAEPGNARVAADGLATAGQRATALSQLARSIVARPG